VAALLAMCLAPAGALATASGSPAGARDQPCVRYAATPARVFHGDDFEFVHTAASAMYCPDDVSVQITACVQSATGAGWADIGCRTSPRTYVGPTTPGGRGVALSFDVPCESGTLRTHVTGGEGLEPTEWDSGTAAIACSGSGPPPVVTPTPTPAPSPAPGVTPPAGQSAGTQLDLTPPVLRVPGRLRRVAATRRGIVRLVVGPCSEDAAGVLTLRARGRLLGRAGFHVAAGRRVAVRVRLSRWARAALRRRGRLAAGARIVLADAAGNRGRAAFRVALRLRPRAPSGA
jgi:hypothetical protein